MKASRRMRVAAPRPDEARTTIMGQAAMTTPRAADNIGARRRASCAGGKARLHSRHVANDCSVDEIVFGRDMDGSGAIHDDLEHIRSGKGCTGSRRFFDSTVDEIVFGRNTDGGGGHDEEHHWHEKVHCKKHSRAALNAQVDSLVFGRDTDGSGHVADEAIGSNYFCQEPMDHYSNRDPSAKDLPPFVRPLPSAEEVVHAYNQTQKRLASAASGMRASWGEQELTPATRDPGRPTGKPSWTT